MPTKAVEDLLVAFEAIGNPAVLRTALDSLRRGGRLCVVGFASEEVPLPLSKVMYFELDVVGSLGCPTVAGAHSAR